MSSTDVATREGERPRRQIEFSRAQLDLLKRSFFAKSTDDEFLLFIEVCRRKRLDPFMRQIHPVKRYDSDQQREVVSFQVSIDALRLQAEESGEYRGQIASQWCGADGKWVEVWLSDAPPAAAKCGVLRAGFDQPIIGIARFKEYVAVKKDGTPTSMWKRMPANQLAKCAEALALRKAFPEPLGGLYTWDEMAHLDVESRIIGALGSEAGEGDEPAKAAPSFGDPERMPRSGDPKSNAKLSQLLGDLQRMDPDAVPAFRKKWALLIEQLQPEDRAVLDAAMALRTGEAHEPAAEEPAHAEALVLKSGAALLAELREIKLEQLAVWLQENGAALDAIEDHEISGQIQAQIQLLQKRAEDSR